MKTIIRIIIVFVVLLLAFGCQNNNQAKLEAENFEIVKKYWDAWNAKDIEVIKKLYDKDNYFYSRTLDNPSPRNYEKTIENVEWNFEYYPDANLEVVEIFASGDKVTSMIIYKGTYTKDMEGYPPAVGQEINVSMLSVMRIKNGKIIEEWEIYNMLAFYNQIGMECKPKE